MKSEQRIPASGLYNGKVSRFEDLGLIATPYGILHKIVLVFSVKSNGSDFEFKRPYTLSLDRRSHLFRDVCALLGRIPTPDYDLRGLVGLPCQLSLLVDTKSNLEKRVRILSIFPRKPCEYDDFKASTFEIKKITKREMAEVLF